YLRISDMVSFGSRVAMGNLRVIELDRLPDKGRRNKSVPAHQGDVNDKKRNPVASPPAVPEKRLCLVRGTGQPGFKTVDRRCAPLANPLRWAGRFRRRPEGELLVVGPAPDVGGERSGVTDGVAAPRPRV